MLHYKILEHHNLKEERHELVVAHWYDDDLDRDPDLIEDYIIDMPRSFRRKSYTENGSGHRLTRSGRWLLARLHPEDGPDGDPWVFEIESNDPEEELLSIAVPSIERHLRQSADEGRTGMYLNRRQFKRENGNGSRQDKASVELRALVGKINPVLPKDAS